MWSFGPLVLPYDITSHTFPNEKRRSLIILGWKGQRSNLEIKLVSFPQPLFSFDLRWCVLPTTGGKDVLIYGSKGQI